MERVYNIETPENLSLTFERAGLATRAFALCIDLSLMGALLQAIVWGLSALELLASSAATALWIIAGFLVQWGYGATCEWRFAGRTLGKRLCSIRVIDASGLRLTFAQAVIRNLLRLADLLPGFHLAGALMSLVDEHGRRIGDLAARTVVVRDRRSSAPAATTLPPARAVLPAFVSQVLAVLRPEERHALRALRESLERLPLAERFALCNELATHLTARSRVTFPPSTSAEGFLLLVEEALSRRSKPAVPRAIETKTLASVSQES